MDVAMSVVFLGFLITRQAVLKKLQWSRINLKLGHFADFWPVRKFFRNVLWISLVVTNFFTCVYPQWHAQIRIFDTIQLYLI